MNFQNLLVGLNGCLQGSGSDNVGQFQLMGQVTPHGTVGFTKQYIGQHAVTYQGILNNGVISGNWMLGNHRGQFEIHMDKIEWNGSYMYGQQRYNISLDIHVDTNGIFGIDKDNEGAFVVRGSYSNETFEMLFTR